MKQLTFISICLILFTLSFTSCKEDDYADWKILNDKWYETHKSDPGFNQTENGLCYKVNYQSLFNKKPNLSSYVTVKYSGKFIDGTVFDSNDAMPPTKLSNLITGWGEGLRLMNVGSNFTFYIPSALGYGDEVSGKIPPYSVLIFEVELLDIE